MSDKDNTFRFKPEDVNSKPHIDRSGSDEYTAARKARHPRKKEKDNRPLIYVSIILMIVLIAVIVVGIFVIGSGGSRMNENNEEVIDMSSSSENEKEPEDEEEEIVEEKEVISSWDMVLDPDSISKTEKGYKIGSTLFDKNGNSAYSGRNIYITGKTDIRDNGKRVNEEAFIKLVKSQSGDMFFFNGTVNEKTNEVISIKYNSQEFVNEEEASEDKETSEKEEASEDKESSEKESTEKEEKPVEEEEKPAEEEKPPVAEEEKPAEIPSEDTKTEAELTEAE